MSCQEFKESGYLYLSNELSPEERACYEKHLRACIECRQALDDVRALWGHLEKLPEQGPSEAVRSRILAKARRSPQKQSLNRRIRAWTASIMLHPRLTWGISTAAVAVFLLWILVRPFGPGSGGIGQLDPHLAWQDDFMAEADWIDNELDRVESGVLLSNYSDFDAAGSESEDWISPLSQELDWIRDKVEYLMKSVYGI